MRSTFAGLSMSLRALMAQQTAVDVTNHNVGNASTDGYSRQLVDFTEATPYTVAALNHQAMAGQQGSGVMVSSIDRARNDFFDQQWRGQNATLGDAQVQQSALQPLQSTYNDPSDTA